jgi:hypothetical protein
LFGVCLAEHHQRHVPSDGSFISSVSQSPVRQMDPTSSLSIRERSQRLPDAHCNGGEEGDVMAWMVAGDNTHFMEDNQESFEEEEPVMITLTPGESMVDGQQEENPSPW